jgi:hypothetical protein
MRRRNQTVLTQVEGQHRVAAELCARGYVPTILPERVQTADLLVLAPEGDAFSVEVKTNRRRSGWFCNRPDDGASPYWVFVELEPRLRFYVLTSTEVQAACDEYQSQKDRGAEGFNVTQLDKHLERWDKLPGAAEDSDAP